MKSLAGLVIVAAHAVAFLLLAARCNGTELVVDVTSPLASPELSIEGVIPAALADRATIDLDDGAPPGAGLHRKRWSVSYRGGFERSVGAAQLVGPFQDPAVAACTGRVVIGQRLLDDGDNAYGTLAYHLKEQLTTELTGESVFPAGDFRRIDKLTVRWARLEWHPYERAVVGEAPHGYVRVRFDVVMDRVTIPVFVALFTSPATTELTFRVAARAELAFDNRVAQWISDKLGGNAFATRITRGHIDGALVRALAPPPPFELPGGQLLQFVYCGGPPEIFQGVSGALPFGIQIGRVAADPAVLPPRRGPTPRISLDPGAQVGLDLDLDALNALLFELWRGGFLDRELAKVGLDRRFNEDPIVTEFLSLRLSPVRLALPPVVAPSKHGLRLSAESRVTIADGATLTTGRLWGGLDFHWAGPADPYQVNLSALELSCEERSTRLVPCYSDLVATVRGRGPELQGRLTDAFTNLITEIFMERRIRGSGLPVELVITTAVSRLTVSATNASLHFDLGAMLIP